MSDPILRPVITTVVKEKQPINANNLPYLHRNPAIWTFLEYYMIKLTYQYNLVLIFLLLLIKVTHNKYKAQSIEDLDSISLQQ